MSINSYFYDSVDGDRPYSAIDFARAFKSSFNTGVLTQSNGSLGLDIGGTDYRYIYAGSAIVEGRFVEVTGSEMIAAPPAGNYDGQVVLRVDANGERAAYLLVKTDRNPVQSELLYELPLYNVTVTNGKMTTIVSDLRTQGGAIASKPPNVGTVLWAGAAMLTGAITPSANIKDCQNGWLVEWRNIEPNTAYYAYTPVYKYQSSDSQTMLDCKHSDEITGGTKRAIKIVMITSNGSVLTGNTVNGSGDNAIRVISRVLAF